jgi:hypothetical protein
MLSSERTLETRQWEICALLRVRIALRNRSSKSLDFRQEYSLRLAYLSLVSSLRSIFPFNFYQFGKERSSQGPNSANRTFKFQSFANVEILECFREWTAKSCQSRIITHNPHRQQSRTERIAPRQVADGFSRRNGARGIEEFQMFNGGKCWARCKVSDTVV